MSKYKNGGYRLSVAGDEKIQNKPVLLADEKGTDIIGGINSSISTINTTLGTKANASTVATKLDQAVIAPDFSKTSTYAVGDLVMQGGKLYECSTAVETAGDFDANDWTQTTIATLIAAIIAQLPTD